MADRSSFLKSFDVFAAILLIIGGVNWGLLGIFNINLVEMVFGGMSPFSRMIYGLVGLAALYEIVMWRSIQRRWHCDVWPSMAEKSAA